MRNDSLLYSFSYYSYYTILFECIKSLYDLSPLQLTIVCFFIKQYYNEKERGILL